MLYSYPISLTQNKISPSKMFPSKRPVAPALEPPLPRSYCNARTAVNAPNESATNFQRFGHSGGSSSTGAGSSSLSTPPPQRKLYVPSIYSYTCRGKFAASSLSANGTKSGGVAGGSGGGTCRGIKSQLELLESGADQQLQLTRAQALERFTTMAADVDMYEYREEGGINRPNHGDNHTSNHDLQPQTQSVLLSPALIFRPDLVQGGHNTGNSVVADAKKSNAPSTTETATTAAASTNAVVTDLLLEEELIVRQDWTCYGSTEVEYMVLKDVATGDSHICAVAPRNTGLSIREIETSDAIRTLTRLGLGWVDIIHDSNALLVDDDEDSETVNNGDKQQESRQRNTGRDGTNTLNPQQQQHHPEEVPPRPSIDALTVAKQSALRMYDFSKHVGEHMQSNAQWFISNVSDDFPNRTYAAGSNIVQRLPKTVELTLHTMQKIVNQWVGSDDDDHDH
jgi:hypothetical protein